MITTNQQKFENNNPVQQWLIRRFQNKLISNLTAVKPQSILEVGCGEGFLLNVLARRFPDCRLMGIDNNRSALVAGRQLFPHLVLEHGDAYRLDLADRSWDVVIASEVLEHLDRPQVALDELHRVAQRYLLLSVPNEPWFRLSNLARGRHLRRLGNHPEHLNLWSRRAFEDFVKTTVAPELVTGAFPWTIIRASV